MNLSALQHAPVAAVLGFLLLPGTARAGVADFVQGCMATIAEFGRLPRMLGQLGWREVGPDEGPRGPAIAQASAARRLWSRPAPGVPDAYTGLTAPAPDAPIEVCWHVTRPGDPAPAILADLRRRYPPLPGTTTTGTEFFYGGREQWSALVGGLEVVIGASYPSASRPADGTAFMFVVKIRPGAALPQPPD